MRVLLLSLTVVFLTGLLFGALPWVVSKRSQSITLAQGVVAHPLSLQSGLTKANLRLVIFDQRQAELVVIDNGPDRPNPHYSSLESALQKHDLVAGTNGSFFDLRTFQAAGWVRIAGQDLSRLPPDSWMRGLVVS